MAWVNGIYQKWVFPIAFVAIAGWFVFVYVFEVQHPPGGTYIYVLGFMAVVVTIWPPENVWSKGAWLAIFFLLTGFEIHNLYRERDRQNQEQATAREEERKAFKAIADGINASITQNQLAFDTTMRRMEGLTQLSAEQINQSTGGDSFCYVEMVTVPRDFMASVVQKGKYPVFNVRVIITDLNAFDAATKSGASSSAHSRTFPTIDFLVRGLSHPLAVYPEDPKLEYKKFNIQISARNGYFFQLLRIKSLKERGWTWATLVTAGYFTGKKGIVFEEVHREFPKDTLKDDKDWVALKKSKVIKVAE